MAKVPITWDGTNPLTGQPFRWDEGLTWDGFIETPDPPIMSTDNRISSTLSAADFTAILGHITAIQALLPFRLSIPNSERNQIAKFGDKSQAFDDKIASYEAQRPDLIPAFTSKPEADKDRVLIMQMKSINGALGQLADDCACTELILGGDLADHDKSFYSSVRFAAANNVNGAQAIFDDLKQRYPAPTKKPVTPTPPPPTP